MESTNEEITFRFDDVCINADIDLINSITNYIYYIYPHARVIFGVSPLVHDNCGERVYPEILNAHSDHRLLFAVDRAGLPTGLHPAVLMAGHGLAHVDHRLLGYEAQEMSILISCSLVKASIFIPPFNKYNGFTVDICKEQNIELIKFEDGWRSMEYCTFDPSHKLWYLHARCWTMDKIIDWFGKWNTL